ncbi:MAG: SixA phosphatase family protein [Planctomycetota bacterium]
MTHLLLMRHAKSDWTDAVLEDHERPLNDRGRRDAPRMGRLLAAEGLMPDLVVCSTAVRARQTLEGLTAGGGLGEAGHAAVVHEASLYLATPGTILAVARAAVTGTGAGVAAGDPERVLLIGHNPGMEQLASRLAGRFVRFPTATIAACELTATGWDDLDAGGGVRGVRVFRPKELPAESGGG